MTTRVHSLPVLLIVLLLAAGCGSSGDPAEPPTEAEATAEGESAKETASEAEAASAESAAGTAAGESAGTGAGEAAAATGTGAAAAGATAKEGEAAAEAAKDAAEAAAAKEPAIRRCTPMDRPGFVAYVEAGAIWAFRTDSKELAAFEKEGEPGDHVTMTRGGPASLALHGEDKETLLDYIVARTGFATYLKNDAIWVFHEGSEDQKTYAKEGGLPKHVTLSGVGPRGFAVKGADKATITAYLNAKPGYVTFLRDGRLWVFKARTEELAAFEKDGEIVKRVTVPGAGPDGMTLIAPDRDTILGYTTYQDGFVTFVEDGTVRVFRVDDPDLQVFQKIGEIETEVTRRNAGPMKARVIAPDRETMVTYWKACGWDPR